MKILNLYVIRNFMGTFLMAIGILTFGMTGSHLMKRRREKKSRY